MLFRGIDLAGLYTGEMSWRRLGVLVAALPPESATKTAVREALTDRDVSDEPEPTGHGPWSHTDLLLAAIADGIHVLAWQQSQIHGGSKAPAPTPIRRPGVTPARPALNEASIAYLNDLRERRRARGDHRR